MSDAVHDVVLRTDALAKNYTEGPSLVEVLRGVDLEIRFQPGDPSGDPLLHLGPFRLDRIA